MKRVNLLFSAFLLIGMLFSTQVMAQGRIDLNAARTTQECANATLNGFTASFSYTSIESTEVETEKGVFSVISMGNALPAGNIGEPQVLVARELIAVPFGATPEVTVKNYTVEEYNLAEFGIQRLYPQQPSQSKSEKEVKFAYNEAAYQAKGFDESRPIAEVTVMGTMRGIQIGALQLNNVRYDASANTIRVYNNVEVEVTFKNADLALTEQTLVNTYSPYFRTVYASLFNDRAIMDVYDDHPDLWTTPVRMLVIANRMFEEAMQPWLTWKIEKGFYVDVNYTDQIGSSASAIKTFITNKYNEGVADGQTPTFLVIIGDKPQVPESQLGSATHKVTDLYYYAVAGNDVFGDMFHSRFTCETVQELQNALNKSLMYEQYTMPDPTYLSNVLLIAGWDSSWNPRVGKPTIQYAMNYYYNPEHGFANVYNFLQTPYNQPYASMNTGVNFVNYTAHGGDTSWSDPSFSVSNANALTNSGKPFLAMGNCCLAANWGYSTKSLGEALLIGQDKGVYAYIGAPVETYWWEDYYFGVGATSVSNQMPPIESTTMGSYDGVFRDDWNCVTAIPFVGNLAVAYSHANGYQGSVSDQYYWEAYHVLGDASVCPYHVNPIANTVNHLPTVPIGMDTYEVSADPGSYVGISKDGVLYGAGEIGSEGVANIPMEPITSGGDVKIVVTHPQRQPYVAVVPAAALTGAYVAVDSYEMNVEQANYGETIDMNINLKNVGTQTANGITATLSTECEYVEITAGEGTLASLNPDQVATIEGFQFVVAENVPDKTKAQFILTVTDGEDVWEGKFNIVMHAPVLEVTAINQTDSELNFTIANTGSAPFYGGSLNIYSSSSNVVIEPSNITFEDTVEGDNSIVLSTNYTVDPSVELGSTFEVAYEMTSGMFFVSDIYIFTYGAIMEDFESGAFSSSWNNSTSYPWSIVSEGRDGSLCAKSGNQGVNSSESTITLTVDVLAAGEITFMYKVSSESSYDKLFFYVDGQQHDNWSGEVAWTQYSEEVTVGIHNFTWTYSKDYSVNSGSDCAWIDDIIFPPTNIVTFINPVTELEATPNDMTVTLTWTASEDAEEYIIKRNDEIIATVTETLFTEELEEEGLYKYTVIASNNGQISTPATVFVDVVYTAVAEGNESTMKVFPNPVSQMLTIATDAHEYTYQLFNSLGQMVISGDARGSKQINVSNLSEGIYTLRITTDSQMHVQRIVVE